MKPINTKFYYVSALIITISLFFAAIVISDYINARRTSEIKAAEEKLTIDILSFETQFDLLKEASCTTFDRTSLRRELDSLSARLNFMEDQVGKDDPDVFRLRRYYSILQIKDYLIAKKMSAECKQNIALILYFYPSKNACADCMTQEYILRAVREKYPQTEIYTFDYGIDLPAVKTLITLHNVPQNPPVYDINGKLYDAFGSLEDMEKVLLPIISKATSTPATSSAKSANPKR